MNRLSQRFHDATPYFKKMVKKKVFIVTTSVVLLSLLFFLLFGIEYAIAITKRLNIDLTENKTPENYTYKHTVSDSDFISPDAPYWLNESEELVMYYYHEKDTASAAPYLLSYVDLQSGLAENLCTDPECWHHKVDTDKYCYLCGLDRSTWFADDGLMYSVWYDRQFYDKRTKSIKYTDGNVDFFNVSLPQKIICFQIGIEKEFTVYEGSRDSRLEIVALDGHYLYFTETLLHSSGKPMPDTFCRDITDLPDSVLDNNGLVIKRDKNGSKALYYYDGESYSPAIFSSELRYQAWEDYLANNPECIMFRVSLDNAGSAGYDCVPISNAGNYRASSYLIIEGYIYRAEDGGYFSYDGSMSPDSRRTVVKSDGWTIRSTQYDPFTDNIYFIGSKEGEPARLYKVYAAGEYRAVREVSLCEEEGYEVVNYQLTYDRIYFQLDDGKHDRVLDFDCVRLNDTYGGAIYSTDYLAENIKTVWQAEPGTNQCLYNPTVIGEYIYADEYAEIYLPANDEYYLGAAYQVRVPLNGNDIYRLIAED